MAYSPDSQSAVVTILTSEGRGHTLNHRQIFSPMGDWVVFDTRNDDTQIGTTKSIERLNLKTGRVDLLYHVSNASPYGPGVGAAAYHPCLEKVIFIHGLTNCDSDRPYGVARRYGALWELQPRAAEFRLGTGLVDGHCIAPPYVPLGTLSGGTHAHSWSPDGTRISFTYDDALRPSMPRTVGFMTSDPAVCQLVAEDFAAVKFGEADPAESFEGTMASFLLLEPDPNLGIRRAVEECWVTNRSIAFQGHILSKKGEKIVEIFVADLPSDSEIADFLRANNRNRSSQTTAGIEFRRVTFLENRSFPGVQGPRHWLIASPDGRSIFFLLKDSKGIVQLGEVGVESGDVRILTSLEQSIEGQISIDETGNRISLVSGGLVWVHDRKLERTVAWTEKGWRNEPNGVLGDDPFPYVGSYVGAVHFVKSGGMLVNRYVHGPSGIWLQILKLESST